MNKFVYRKDLWRTLEKLDKKYYITGFYKMYVNTENTSNPTHFSKTFSKKVVYLTYNVFVF